MVDSPGDPARVGSFLACHENENKTAAYLDFQNTADLRTAAISWPVLKGLRLLRGVPAYTTVKHVLSLLHRDLGAYQNVDNLGARYPLDSEGGKHQQVACILSNMVNDFEAIAILGQEENQTRQAEALSALQAVQPKLNKLPTVDVHSMTAPSLGPLQGESRLEAHNRCWMLLKYFKYCQAMKDADFEKRFPEDGSITGMNVLASHTPSWMRPKSPSHQHHIQHLVAVRDSLPDKKFSLIYDPKFDSSETVDELKKNFEAVELDPPSKEPREFTLDPRLFDSCTSLRDHIRRQFNCQKFHTDLFRVEIECQRTEPDKDEENLVLGLFGGDWSVILAAMCDEHNDNFNFRVGLYALDRDNRAFDPFEMEMPSYMAAFLQYMDAEGTSGAATDTAEG